MNVLRTEPARLIGAVTALVTAGIALLVAFGVPLTDTQQVAILSVVAAVAPLLAALVIRERVYAPATVAEFTEHHQA